MNSSPSEEYDSINEEENLKIQKKFLSKLKRFLLKHSRRQWYALLAINYLYFASSIGITMLASYFPKMALERGVNDLESGLIFGCGGLIVAVFSPIFGYFIPYTGGKKMLLAGTMILCISNFLFSQAFRFKTKTNFVIACFVTRSLEGFGNTAYYLGFSIILIQEWKDHITFSMGVSEIFNAFGLIFGPVIGGWLYQKGGFQCPAIFAGAILLIGFIMSCFAIIDQPSQYTEVNYFKILRNRNVVASTVLVCMMYAAMNLILPLLYEHMLSLKDDSPVLVGEMILIMATTYAVFSLLVGIFTQTKFAEKTSMLSGVILVGISYLTIGPSPVLSIFHFRDVTETGIAISLCILGTGLSMAIVPSFNYMNSEAIEGGMPDNLATYGLVGGLFNSMSSLGDFLGPFIGTALMQHLQNFKIVSSLFAAIIFVLALIFCLLYIMDWLLNKRNYHSGYKSLSEDSSEELIQ